MRRTSLVLGIILLAHCLSAQVLMNRDSLLKLMPSVKEDSAGAEFYINLGQQYESSETELAKYYYRKAGGISEKIGYQPGVLKYIFNYTFVLNMQGRYDSSLALNLKSVEVARALKDPVMLGKALFNTGTSYRLLTQYENAIPLFEEGRKIFSANGDSLLIGRSSDIIQMLYFQLGDYDRAITYGETSVKWMRNIDDPVWLGTALNNLGMSYSKKGYNDKAKEVWIEALSISKKIGNLEMEASQMLNLADLQMNTGEYEGLREKYERALVLYRKIDAVEGMAISLRGLATDAFFRKDLSAAKEYGLRSLEVIDQNDLLFERKKSLETLSQISFASGELKEGHRYLKEAAVIEDSLNNERIRRKMVEFETKYEVSVKDARIKLQQAEIQRKSTLNYILIGSALAVLVIFMLSFRNYKQKQQLQQKRIVELEQENQLAATEAVLKGEEQERTRLAKDLHDGLGGMLSGIKYSMNTMKGNLIMTEENARAFERSMDMLDSSISEMRRVAHNMMPEALVKFGLDAALRDFCNGVTESGALQVRYQSINVEGHSINQTTAITLYRVVQELINNTIKHASARKAIVQLSRKDGRLYLEVEDDGVGFDTAILETVKGIGWTNIKNRVGFLKGVLDVHSEKGKGTSVHIELNA